MRAVNEYETRTQNGIKSQQKLGTCKPRRLWNVLFQTCKVEITKGKCERGVVLTILPMWVTLTVYWEPSRSNNTVHGSEHNVRQLIRSRGENNGESMRRICKERAKRWRLYRRARDSLSSLRSISRRQPHCVANYDSCWLVSTQYPSRHSLLRGTRGTRINEYWFRAIIRIRSRNKIEWVFENL